MARFPGQADAVLVKPGQAVGVNQALIGAATARHGLPSISFTRDYAAAGGLIAYASRLSDLERRAADYADRILRGAHPADLPIEGPTRYDLIVNMRTARALGITLSPAFLARVDEVIE